MKVRVKIRIKALAGGVVGTAALLVLLLLSACAGGHDEDGVVGTGVVDIEGTAATGEPLANVAITLRDADNLRHSTTSDAQGKYSLRDVRGEGPFLIRAQVTDSMFYYSIAHRGEDALLVRNVHPLTDLIVRAWFVLQGVDIDAEFDSPMLISSMPSAVDIAELEEEIRRVVEYAMGVFDVSAGTNLLSTPFDADGTGFDAFLFNSLVVINGKEVSLFIQDPELGIQATMINALNLENDLTAPLNTLPSLPENLRALLGDHVVYVAWDSATDDRGVAGYSVKRNGEKIAMTPYSFFADTNVTQGMDYLYEVEAIDSHGASSGVSVANETLHVSGTAGNSPPPVPTALQIQVVDNDVMLTWDAVSSNDVFRYRVRRGLPNSSLQEIVSVTATSFNDYNLEPGEYCYDVIAEDAVGNQSSASEIVCIAIGGIVPRSMLSLASTAYIVSENTPSIDLIVQRSGAADGAISVDYLVTEDTATVGSDYRASRGTLTWDENDFTDKAISIPILTDTLQEATETFWVDLTSPSVNATLGANVRATVNIRDHLVGNCANLPDTDIMVDLVLTESCYDVQGVVQIFDGVRLTVSPGVILRFSQGAELRVEPGGSLVATGTPNQLIYFSGAKHVSGYWHGIRVLSALDANRLEYVVVEDAGDSSIATANIMVEDAPTNPGQLKLDNVTTRNSGGLGFDLQQNTSSLYLTKITSTLNNQGPGQLAVTQLSTLDPASRLSGNGIDALSLVGANLDGDHVWENYDVPLRIQSLVSIDGLLKIKAGNTLAFDSAAGLQINGSGQLQAQGTVDQPVIFTGSITAQNIWSGIKFSNSDTGNLLDNVIVEKTGSIESSLSLAAITLSGGASGDIPSTLTLSNSTVRDNLLFGVWAETGSNYTSTNNLFENNLLGDESLDNPPVILP